MHPALSILLFNVVLQSVIISQSYKQNTLSNMKNGMQDNIILSLYQEEIDNVYSWTGAKEIYFWVYDCDLNDDGNNDKIVFVYSPLHGGTGGIPLDIWSSDSAGEYRRIQKGLVLRVLSGDSLWEKAGMYILPMQNNGYYNIDIVSPDYHILLKYDGTQYQANFLHLQNIGE
jgi:hypothetical protein